MKNMLEVSSINKTYNSFKLKDISFSVPSGSIMGLIGQNGAGKSTIIKSILNLINLDRGQVKVFNEVLGENNKHLNNDIGVVFDDIHFYDGLNVKEIEKIVKNIYSNWDRDTFFNYTNKFKLPTDKKIKNFSKGMKMKLSISIALSHRPKLLILDEATSGLDPITRDEMLDIFLDFIQDENHSILISSHITSDLEKIADYITFIHDGEILFSKNKDELIYDYGVIKCSKDKFNDIDKEDIVSYRENDYNYEVLINNKENLARKYNKFVIDNTNLEEIMLLYVKGMR